MSVLKSLENKIAGLVEGTFSRAFRSEVRPVEIARKLAREMEEHKVVSLSRTYVPNEYSVWLSPADRELFEGVEHEVIDELCAYLLEHARREQLILPSSPLVVFHTDERLALGEFGIQAELVVKVKDIAWGVGEFGARVVIGRVGVRDDGVESVVAAVEGDDDQLRRQQGWRHQGHSRDWR